MSAVHSSGCGPSSPRASPPLSPSSSREPSSSQLTITPDDHILHAVGKLGVGSPIQQRSPSQTPPGRSTPHLPDLVIPYTPPSPVSRAGFNDSPGRSEGNTSFSDFMSQRNISPVEVTSFLEEDHGPIMSFNHPSSHYGDARDAAKYRVSQKARKHIKDERVLGLCRRFVDDFPYCPDLILDAFTHVSICLVDSL
ncbi:hypothetical protein CONPUDRAFT_152751 [Coniophora puteana RWD-64-598 SS2]|uniref:Uncharacterized protein n=1 Tax=Coniophora puteana (strain RWD-64-598) TaxID=741705 RepID=A0A5M3MRR5_CONPW|nr:uncharacterized protein CONPUDRAFT_152751 [Coniophora puteana RWD-64-598 SS2]EIW81848.1 hypothetical protein CONPUDRAFT_152751 [Coniophora puteana RWD-64-598 SS2]